jgi:hypothetical protein
MKTKAQIPERSAAYFVSGFLVGLLLGLKLAGNSDIPWPLICAPLALCWLVDFIFFLARGVDSIS